MDWTAFYYLEGSLLFGFIVAAGLTVISLARPDYWIARLCAWAASILFGSIAVIWGVTTMEHAWIRIPAVGLAGFVAAVCLTEALRFITNRESAFHPVGAQTVPARGPTLEATGHSTIDATGATIPGDLPFQFGKAESDSLIAMPGINVTKTENGWVVKPSQANLAFPPAPPQFAVMPIGELKQMLQNTAHDLREIQQQFTDEQKNVMLDREKMSEIAAKYARIYEEKFADLNVSLCAAAIQHIGTLSGLPVATINGGRMIYYKKFAAPTPAQDAPAFLEALASKLPSP